MKVQGLIHLQKRPKKKTNICHHKYKIANFLNIKAVTAGIQLADMIAKQILPFEIG